MKIIIFIATLFAIPSFAQTTNVPQMIISSEPFSSEGKVELSEMQIATRTNINKIESGSINGVSYRFYYSDGSGTFAGQKGNDTEPGNFIGSNWNIGCEKDAVTDKKQCHMNLKNLWIFVYPNGRATVSVGSDHFPGSSVTVRIDSGAPITTSAGGDGNFSAPSSAKIIERLSRAKTITTRYMKWPYRSWVDDTWDVYGFNEALKYLKWAVKHIH